MRREQHAANPRSDGWPTDLVEGRPFMFPPSGRLLCAFDDEREAARAASELAESGVQGDAVWVYRGRDGASRIDTAAGRHGLHIVVGRFLQRRLTNDDEYCAVLRRTATLGGVVLAIRVERGALLGRVLAILRRHGAQHASLCAHWNYTPLPDGGTG